MIVNFMLNQVILSPDYLHCSLNIYFNLKHIFTKQQQIKYQIFKPTFKSTNCYKYSTIMVNIIESTYLKFSIIAKVPYKQQYDNTK